MYFHSKGIDMVCLPSILPSRKVNGTIPTFINYTLPHAVSNTYFKTIASKIFTFTNLDFDKRHLG